MPAVSVITPAYNVEPYIGQAIESVLGQTFTDFEQIVVDDGSTDGTLRIVEAAARNDRRIRVLRQNNQGIAGARNRAIQAASGRMIAILDGDDVWAADYLATQMAILDCRPEIDVVTGNAWFLGGREDGHPARPTPDPRPAPTLATILDDETAVFIMSVFRRRVWDAIDGFDETLRTNEDYDFWLRAAVAGFRFVRNDTPLGYYRRRGDSLSANHVRMLRGILQVLVKCRPSLGDLPAERAVVDRKILQFDTERLAAEARQALASHDFQAARVHLEALLERRAELPVRVASLMARRAPSLLALACNAPVPLRRLVASAFRRKVPTGASTSA